MDIVWGGGRGEREGGGREGEGGREGGRGEGGRGGRRGRRGGRGREGVITTVHVKCVTNKWYKLFHCVHVFLKEINS